MKTEQEKAAMRYLQSTGKVVETETRTLLDEPFRVPYERLAKLIGKPKYVPASEHWSNQPKPE